MSELFLSHSSRNNAEALALRDWLVSEGWANLFLDLDPERGIVAGERWERALHQAASRCDAVLFLVSRHWLGSEWCRREFHLAQRLNKRIVVLLVEDIPISELPAELTENQLVSLASGNDHESAREVTLPGQTAPSYVYFSQSGLQRLRTGLNKAGLDPHSFPWPLANDPDRPPYRGLRPLLAEDAGIFFGREAPIIELLAQLRGLRDAAPPRFLAILGASGAGKSSFLRAGILPRLARDDRHYLPLPVIRPEQGVLSGSASLLACLREVCRARGLSWTRRQLADAIESGAPAVRPILMDLAISSAVPEWDQGESYPPTLILPIDQGEELFQSDGRDEAKHFLALLGELLTQESPSLVAVFTIRSDSYDALQSAPELQGILQRTFSLPPMPKGAYRQVIEEPVALLSKSNRPLRIDPKLTDALMHDIERGGAKDSLPLLAFTLERLYLEYGDDGDLRLEEYEDLGRIEGAIETAVEQALKAAQHDPKLPRDRDACLKLLRRGLIPWLAGIDPQTNLPRRKVAKLSQVPDEASPVIRHFVEHRLLATDTDEQGEITVEPAHEALLRQWTKLRGWLEEDAAALATLETLKSASRDWDANGKAAKWLVHQTGRLEDAENLHHRVDLAANLDVNDRSYLAECRKREDELRDKELRQARELAKARESEAQALRRASFRTRTGMVVASVLAAVASWLGWQAYLQQQVAEQQTNAAETRLLESSHNLGLVLIEKAEAHSAALRQQEATFLRSFAHSLLQESERTANVGEVLKELDRSPMVVWTSSSALHHGGGVNSVAFSRDGSRMASASEDRTIRLWDGTSGALLRTLQGHSSAISSVAFSPDGSRLASGSADRTIRIWDADSGSQLRTLVGHSDSVNCVVFSPNGALLASGSDDHTIKMWDSSSGALVETLSGHLGSVQSVGFNPDGTWLASGSLDETIRLWNASDGALLQVMEGHASWVTSVAFSPDGARLASGSGGDGNNLRIWDAASRALLVTMEGHVGGVRSIAFSPDGAELASGGWDATIKTWDAASGVQKGSLAGHMGGVNDLAFSPDGTQLLSGSHDSTIRLWDSEGGVSVSSSNAHSGPVWRLAFSPDGRRLVTGQIRGQGPKLWDTVTGELLHSLDAPSRGVTALAFDTGGALLASSASDDGSIQLWSVDDGGLLGTFAGHSEGVFSIALSPNEGARLASASYFGEVKLWDARTNELLQTLDPGVTPDINEHHYETSLAFSPDATRLISVSKGMGIRHWDATSGKLLRSLEVEVSAPFVISSDSARLVMWSEESIDSLDTDTGESLNSISRERSDRASTIALSDDGTRLAATFLSAGVGRIELWDLAAGKLESVLAAGGTAYGVALNSDGLRLASGSKGTVRLWDASGADVVIRHSPKHSPISDWASCLAFSPEESHLAACSADSNVWLWDIASGELTGWLEGHSERVTSVAFSPKGARLASGARDHTVRLWKTESMAWWINGEPHPDSIVLKGHSGPVRSVAFSPDGTRLASGSEDHTIRLWDTTAGLLTGTLEGHVGTVSGVAFSPDGSRLASGAGDNTIKLWDAASGALLHTLVGHSQGVTSVAFSPDGTRLASGAHDKTIRFWDVANGDLLSTLDVHKNSVESIAFSPDGMLLVSGAQDATIRLWDAKSGVLRIALHSDSGAYIALSPSGTRLASGGSDDGIRLWDLAQVREDANSGFVGLLESQGRLLGVRLQGVDLAYEPRLATNVYSEPASGRPLWPRSDPFHWLPVAEGGEIDAMIEAGNAYLRREQFVEAYMMFERASSHTSHNDARAIERLRLSSKALSRELQ